VSAIARLQVDVEQRYLDTIHELRTGFDVQLSAQREAFDVALAAKDETIAELRRRAEAAESRVRDLEQQHVESSTPAEPDAAATNARPWWRLW
jgi:hypothetical protein